VQQPVGETAVSNLAVRPRADARIAVKAMIVAQLDEGAQVAVARPVPLALLLLVVNPEDIRRHDGDTARFHFEQFLLPILARIAGKVKLAQNRKPDGLSKLKIQ